MNDAPKPEAPFALDLDFGEALARFAQTKPEEVEPAPGQKKKAARPEPGRFAEADAGASAPHRNKTTPAAGTGE
jgi:hypothetical protein